MSIWNELIVGLCMAKPVKVSEKQINWLKKNHESMSLNDVASQLGVCVDTLKRILVREGIRDFEGAKYVVARKEVVNMWDRACMDCGTKEQRPKNWYYCKACRAARGFDDY